MDKRFKETLVGQVEDLCEFRLELDGEEDQEVFPLRATVIMTEADVDLRQHTFRVGVTRADLTIRLEGCETVMGSTFGQRLLGEMETTETRVIEKSRAIGITGDASTDLSDTNLGGQGEFSYRRTDTIERTRKTASSVAKYKANGRWRLEVETPDGKPKIIDGVALDNAVLAELRPLDGANRIELSAEVSANKRDLKIEFETSIPFANKAMSTANRDAVIAAIVRKAISRGLGTEADYSGPKLVLARAGIAEA